MEASKVLSRSLRLAALRSQICECPSTTWSRAFMAIPIRPRPQSHRSFSASTRRRGPTLVKPRSDTINSAPSAPLQPAPNPKHELQEYTDSLQKLIDGYKLESRLPDRQHASLVAALNNTKSRLDAPRAHPESFAPLLKQLQGEVEPIFQINLGSSNVTQLLADMSQQKGTSSPIQSFEHEPSPPPTQINPKAQSLSEKLDAIMGNRTPKTPIKTTPRLREDDGGDPTSKTLDGLLDLYSKSADSDGSPTTSTSRTRARETSLSIQDRLLANDSAFRRNQRSKHAVIAPALRLKPSLGRTVEVKGDLTRAWRQLELLCARNQVKRDLQKQRFHVRRGQKKKILKRDRWRKMFKEGFMAECDRVRRMRRQGW